MLMHVFRCELSELECCYFVKVALLNPEGKKTNLAIVFHRNYQLGGEQSVSAYRN